MSPIFANIDARAPKPNTTTPGPGGIREIVTGQFDGTIDMQRMEVSQQPSGDFLGEFTFANHVDGIIRIGGSFTSGFEDQTGIGGGPSENTIRRINVNADQMRAQIIVNSNNAGNLWSSGEVITPSVSLFGPSYSQLPSDLGGGSIAEVPYNLHKEASDPAHNSTFVADLSLLTVRVRFYGPVSVPGTITAANFPFIIEQGSNAGGPWALVTNPEMLYSVEIDQFDPNTALISENTFAGFAGNTFYRIRPNANVLSEGIVTPVPVNSSAGQELIFAHNGGGGVWPPDGEPNPCETCECPRTCLIVCEPCFGFSSTTEGRSFVTNSNGRVYDELLVNANGAHVQHQWLFPGPLGPNATDGRSVTSLNRPKAHASPDINRDGIVDGNDLNAFMATYGCLNCIDLDGDWDQDESDLKLLAAAMTAASSPSVR